MRLGVLYALASLITSVLSAKNCTSLYNVTEGCDQQYGVVIEELGKVGTVMQCSVRCTNNRKCVSVKFDPHSKVCQINSEPFVNVSTQCNAKLEFASLSAISCRVSVGDPCSSPAQCTIVNSQCKNGQCFCASGYSYNPAEGTCVSECMNDNYGRTFSPDPGYVLDGYNNRVIYDSSVSNCQTNCVEEATFLCRTAEFSFDDNTCYLSEETALTVPNKYTALASYSIFQRDCGE